MASRITWVGCIDELFWRASTEKARCGTFTLDGLEVAFALAEPRDELLLGVRVFAITGIGGDVVLLVRQALTDPIDTGKGSTASAAAVVADDCFGIFACAIQQGWAPGTRHMAQDKCQSLAMRTIVSPIMPNLVIPPQ